MDDPNKKDDPSKKDTGKKPVSPGKQKATAETSPRPPKLMIGGAASAAAAAALRQAAEAFEKPFSSDSSGDDDHNDPGASAGAGAVQVAPGTQIGASGPEEDTNKDPLQVEAQAQSGQKRKKGELDAPRSEPACSICRRKFNSWKAVFGHMRAHPEREWRGAFPPPKGEQWAARVADAAAGEQQDVQVEMERQLPHLVNIAEQVIIQKMREEEAGGGGAAAAAGASAAGARVRNIDLNLEPVNSSSSSSSSNSPPEKRRAVLDLNQPPPRSRGDKDGKNDDGDDHAAAGAS